MSVIETMAWAIYDAFEEGSVLDKYGDFAGGFRVDGVVDAPALVRAALRAAEEEGWVLVPKEPGPQMEEILRENLCYEGDSATPHAYEWTLKVYRSMLAARPEVK